MSRRGLVLETVGDELDMAMLSALHSRHRLLWMQPR
jgi:hypothetical protein